MLNNYDNKNEKKISATVNRKFLNKKIIDCLGDGAVWWIDKLTTIRLQ